MSPKSNFTKFSAFLTQANNYDLGLVNTLNKDFNIILNFSIDDIGKSKLYTAVNIGGGNTLKSGSRYFTQATFFYSLNFAFMVGSSQYFQSSSLGNA
jgi:hypothetical protein